MCEELRKQTYGTTPIPVRCYWSSYLANNHVDCVFLLSNSTCVHGVAWSRGALLCILLYWSACISTDRSVFTSGPTTFLQQQQQHRRVVIDIFLTSFISSCPPSKSSLTSVSCQLVIPTVVYPPYRSGCIIPTDSVKISDPTNREQARRIFWAIATRPEL